MVIYKTKMKREIVNVLWTGGYDSSFRVIELSKLDLDIQPYYLSDNRESEKNELNAIAEISKDIRLHPETKCNILPLITYNVSEVKDDKETTIAYSRLRNKIPLGTQYDWLARFALQNNLDSLELGLEKAYSSVAYVCITKFGALKLIENEKEVLSYYIIDKEQSHPDLYKVFGLFRMPYSLFNLTKKEMLVEYDKLGFKNSVGKTWSCHKPINNKPCGYCHPCKSIVQEGMSFRITPAGLRRYRMSKFYITKNKIISKLNKLVG